MKKLKSLALSLFLIQAFAVPSVLSCENLPDESLENPHHLLIKEYEKVCETATVNPNWPPFKYSEVGDCQRPLHSLHEKIKATYPNLLSAEYLRKNGFLKTIAECLRKELLVWPKSQEYPLLEVIEGLLPFFLGCKHLTDHGDPYRLTQEAENDSTYTISWVTFERDRKPIKVTALSFFATLIRESEKIAGIIRELRNGLTGREQEAIEDGFNLLFNGFYHSLCWLNKKHTKEPSFSLSLLRPVLLPFFKPHPRQPFGRDKLGENTKQEILNTIRSNDFETYAQNYNKVYGEEVIIPPQHAYEKETPEVRAFYSHLVYQLFPYWKTAYAPSLQEIDAILSELLPQRFPCPEQIILEISADLRSEEFKTYIKDWNEKSTVQIPLLPINAYGDLTPDQKKIYGRFFLDKFNGVDHPLLWPYHIEAALGHLIDMDDLPSQ